MYEQTRHSEKKGHAKGFSLIEVIMASAIISVVTYAAYTSLGELVESSQRNNATQLQVEMEKKLTLQLTTDNIGASLNHPDNADLRNCVTRTNGSTAMCTVSVTNKRRFTLIHDKTAEPITGSTGSPLYFTRTGQPCTVFSNECVYEARSFFWTTCAEIDGRAPSATCTNPPYLDFVVQYKMISTSPKHLKNLKDYPTDRALTDFPYYYSVRIKASDLLKDPSFRQCSTGGILAGIDNNGNPICECIIPSFDRMGRRASYPNCQPQICGPDELFTGFDSTGRIQCVDQAYCLDGINDDPPTIPRGCPCEVFKMGTEAGEKKECTQGFWMVGLRFGACYATSSKKQANDTVQCESNTATCCRVND